MFHRSKRLFLRPCWAEDWNAIYHGIADEGVVRNLASAPWPYTPEDARDFVARNQNGRLPQFAVTLPNTGIIGSVGLAIAPQTNDVELGYWIARKWWGQGFATEAARSILSVAQAIGHTRIVASHFTDNPASGKVLRKAGFTPTGTVRPQYSTARRRDDPAKTWLYSL